jgi:hypothetical protein
MFIIFVHTKCHIPSSNSPLDKSAKLKATENVHIAALLLFYVSTKTNRMKRYIDFKYLPLFIIPGPYTTKHYCRSHLTSLFVITKTKKTKLRGL